MGNKLTFIDLFAGCGGLSEGFMQTNSFEALAHVEWEKPMVKTLQNRLIKKWNYSIEEATKSVVHFDIQKSDELIYGNWSDDSKKTFGELNSDLVINEGLKGLVGKRKVNLIIGGPPCQAYSLAGRAQDKNSMKEDYRNYLFESFVKVVDAFKPDVFVFENVQGLLSACPGNVMVTDRIFKAFNEIGYEISNPKDLKKAVYTATDFGVPQRRNRIIIIGVNRDNDFDLKNLYESIDEQKKKNIATTREAIGHLPKLIPLPSPLKLQGKNISHKQESKIPIKFHEPRFHNERDIKIFKKWLDNNMNKKSMNDKIDFYNKILNKNSKHAKYRNLEWDQPSPTIVAHLYKDGLMFIHPDSKQARSITVKEAALLQSFPDDFEFLGSNGDCFKMIGNAVPPLMAKRIAEGLKKYFNNVEMINNNECTCSM